MPPGEEMFKFHGYSGPCPKPPDVHNAVNMVETVNLAPCEGDRHRWPADYQEGDTCNCGAFYAISARDGLIIERAPEETERGR
jgi:hypothetical protein